MNQQVKLGKRAEDGEARARPARECTPNHPGRRIYFDVIRTRSTSAVPSIELAASTDSAASR